MLNTPRVLDFFASRIFAKLKTVISQHSLALSLGGIILLAFMVNLIETCALPDSRPYTRKCCP